METSQFWSQNGNRGTRAENSEITPKVGPNQFPPAHIPKWDTIQGSGTTHYQHTTKTQIFSKIRNGTAVNLPKTSGLQ